MPNETDPVALKLAEAALACAELGHEYEEFIDPRSGGFIRCKNCGHQHDCEDPDGDLG